MTSGFGPQNSGGVTLGGTIAMKAGDHILIAADGEFQQSGTLNVGAADYVIIDTTGTTAEQLRSQSDARPSPPPECRTPPMRS